MKFQFFFFVAICLGLAAACSPGAQVPEPTPTAVPTQTAAATPTLVPTATRTRMPAAPSVTPTFTLAPPTETPLPEDCNQASVIEDVTIPDGALVDPGEVFLKIWRVQNTGSCTWQWGSFWLVFDSENQMNGPDLARAYFYPSQPVLDLATLGNAAWNGVLGEVAPGEVVDIPLLLQAPDKPGVYRSHWHLQDKAGNSAALMWVLLVVDTQKEIQQPDWSGNWLHANTWFINRLVDPGVLVVEQRGSEILGFFYPRGGPADGDLVYVTGRVSEDGMQVEGLFSLVWDEPIDFQWAMSANQQQFEGLITSERLDIDGTWCGGRNGLVPPICAP
ncbi:MAG: hypothetical protein H8E28_12910 [Anaerolineae bacterium]|nr:hypothetical protein [Anaerolineae bacterium]